MVDPVIACSQEQRRPGGGMTLIRESISPRTAKNPFAGFIQFEDDAAHNRDAGGLQDFKGHPRRRLIRRSLGNQSRPG